MPSSVDDRSLDALLAHHATLRPVADVPELVAHQATDLFALWHAWETLCGETNPEPPFWATVWPAARGLAITLARAPELIRGRRVLELGCGGGVAAIAAARAGARQVVANDIDPTALRIATRNAAANGAALSPEARDCSTGDFGDAEVILVADLFYQRSVSERLIAALRRSSARVLVADGGRAFAPPTVGDLLYEDTLAVDPVIEGVPQRTVRVCSLL